MGLPASGYDATFRNLNVADTIGTASVMLSSHRQQDITPSSARRSDGDARFQLIPSESYWSQSDFAGGYGRILPQDKTMYWGSGPIDTTEGRVIRAAFAFDQNFTAVGTVLAICKHRGLIYVAVNDAGTGKLYSLATPTAAGTFVTNLASPSVTTLCSFRKDLWIGYGTASNVQKWDGATLTTPAPNFKAQVLAPYSSMIFYVFYNSTNQTWRINRYDPENTGAIADLAIIPRGDETTDYARSLQPLGADLFVATQDSLWKFTSQNGNSGTLVGPIDEWVPLGGTGMEKVAGYGCCTFQGALLYGVGGGIRRHQPGGGSRTIWPVAPNVNDPTGNGSADFTGGADAVCGLVQAHDRVYAVLSSDGVGSTTSSSHSLRVLCWTGQGMHWIATQAIGYAAAQTIARSLVVADDTGYVLTATMASGTPNSGATVGVIGVAGGAIRKRATSSTWTSSILDFGLYDIDKVIRRVYVAATVPNTSTYTITTYLLDRVNNTLYTLAKTGTYSTTFNIPATCSYDYGGAALISRLWQILVQVDCPSGATSTPEVHLVACIPNPSYPVRYGFRLVIPLNTGEKNHNGAMVYADQAAVDTAVQYWRDRRASPHPFYMDFFDGTTYEVRANTIALARDMTRPGEAAWMVTLDLQQLS